MYFFGAFAFLTIAVLKKVRYALCPMPYALCPMPYARRVPHVTEKGYISVFFSYLALTKKYDRGNLRTYSREIRTESFAGDSSFVPFSTRTTNESCGMSSFG